jgi:ABC-type oligopeptide transport system ATPase subunit
VLDEAVSALDVSIRAQILDLLAGCQDRLDLSYLFISMICRWSRHHRPGAGDEGRQDRRAGRDRTVFRNPQHPYTQKLIVAATPSLEAALAAPAD